MRIAERILTQVGDMPDSDDLGIPFSECAGLLPDEVPNIWARWGGESFYAVHGFVEDWRLEAVWRKGPIALPRCTYLVEPDYSVPYNCAPAFAVYQTWRTRLVGTWARQSGMIVIPSLNWGHPRTYPFVFRGLLPGGTYAVRGPGPTPSEIEQWHAGMSVFVSRWSPSAVVYFGVYGRVSPSLKDLGVFVPRSLRTEFGR